MHTLQDAPFSIVAGPADVASAGASFGLINGPTVNSSIGINLAAEVSPGDTVSILARFDVIPLIPEPGTLGVLAMGAIALLRRRNRAA
jgi:hypothetical protein